MKVDAPREGRPDEGMDMAFDKTGQQHFSGQVDDARIRPDEGVNAGVVADVDDALPFDRDGACPGLVCVDSVDGTISENDVGA